MKYRLNKIIELWIRISYSESKQHELVCDVFEFRLQSQLFCNELQIEEFVYLPKA